MSYYAIIDIGTTTVKSFLVNDNGEILSKSVKEYKSVSPAPTYHEQNPETWWNLAGETMREALEKKRVDKENIRALSLITQRATLVPIDSNGNALHNAITWMDSRNVDLKEEEKEILIQRVPLRSILWFKRHSSEIYEKSYKFALVDSFFSYKLVGETFSSPSQAIYLYYDPEVKRYNEDVLEKLEVDVEKLPKVIESFKVIGDLEKKAADHLGLKEGTPVIIGAGDQQSSAVGLNLLNHGDAKITIGTGTFIDVVSDKKLFDFYEENAHLFVLPHAIEGKWLLEAVLPGTGALVKWFAENFALTEEREREKSKISVYEILDKKAESVAIGADGLLLIPLFSFGKGLIKNLSFHHTKYHMFRAILEGTSFGARFFVDLIESLDFELSELAVDGGGSNSRLWLQIHSDIMQKKLKLSLAGPNASVVGAAVLASFGVKQHESIESAAKSFVKFVDVIKPDEKSFEVYEELYGIFMDKMLEISEELEV
ncbi:MAG: FGGY-family carbohydrate kinase [Candidatus Njordarchaeia archaeon]